MSGIRIPFFKSISNWRFGVEGNSLSIVNPNFVYQTGLTIYFLFVSRGIRDSYFKLLLLLLLLLFIYFYCFYNFLPWVSLHANNNEKNWHRHWAALSYIGNFTCGTHGVKVKADLGKPLPVPVFEIVIRFAIQLCAETL